MSNSFVGGNALLIRDVRGKLSDWFGLPGRIIATHIRKALQHTQNIKTLDGTVDFTPVSQIQ